MSNNRVKIINPLSLQTCGNLSGSSSEMQGIQTNYQGYHNSVSTPVTPKPSTPKSLIVEPLALIPLNDTANESSVTGTSSSSENLEFPSSALDLYATLLNEIGDSTNQPQISHLSSPKLQRQRPLSNLPEENTSIGSLGITTDSNEFRDYQLGSEHALGNTDAQHEHELVGIDTENLDQSNGAYTQVSSLGDETSHEIPVGSLGYKLDKRLLNIRCADKLQDTIDNLPDVVENVSQAQKHQLEEVGKQQEMLHEVQRYLQQERDKIDDLRVELASCKRNICLAEDTGTQMEKQCKQLEKDICKAMADDFDICKLSRVEEDKQKENTRLYEKYRCKMNNHSQAVNKVEETMEVNMEVKIQQGVIKSLETLKNSMESKLTDVDHEKRLQEDIKNLTMEKMKLEGDISKIELQIKQEVSKHISVNQDVEVLHKRNQAQMTRLKKQVKEAHLRNRQWNEEACQLERHLEELRKSMEE